MRRLNLSMGHVRSIVFTDPGPYSKICNNIRSYWVSDGM